MVPTKVEKEKARATTTPGVQAVQALVVGHLLKKEKERTKEKARQTERTKEQKGKGKCWTCGGNHYERDCWYKNRSVQQVTEESAVSGSNQAPAAASSGSGSSSSNQSTSRRRAEPQRDAHQPTRRRRRD